MAYLLFQRSALLFLALLLCSTLASSYTQLSLIENSCYADGSFAFTIDNQKTTPLSTDDMAVTARHSFLNITPGVRGVWTKNLIYENVNDTTPNSRRTTFYSEASVLTAEGDYYATVKYIGCRESPNCKLTFSLSDCPAFDPFCEREKLTTTRCEQDGKTLSIWFKGIADDYETVVPDNDAYYYLRLDTGATKRLPRFTTIMTYDTLGQNWYKVNLPLDAGDHVVRAGAVKKNCDTAAREYALVECTDAAAPAPALEPSSIIIYEPPQPADKEAPAAPAASPPSPPPAVEQDSEQLPVDLVEQPVPVGQPGAGDAGIVPAGDAAINLPVAQPVPVPPVVPVADDSQQAPAPARLYAKPSAGLDQEVRIPFHFYLLVGIIALGILMLILGNRKRQ